MVRQSLPKEILFIGAVLMKNEEKKKIKKPQEKNLSEDSIDMRMLSTNHLAHN